jgi:hypothetical protein
VAAGHLDRAEQLAESTGDPDIIADVLMARLITYSGVATVSHETIDWADRLNALQHSRCREDSVIADSVSTMAAMNLGDVDAAERRLAAGIAGSEELQLPVLRAQLRWMEAVLAAWRGDFVEAERHHAIAAHVHEQTELYEAGSGLVAAVSLLREEGTPVPSGWPGITASGETGGQGMVKTALLAVDDGPDARANAVAILDGWVAGTGRPHVWTTLGHTVLLAHLAADHGLTQCCGPLLAELEPYGDRIAVIGQVGIAGPVALSSARLHALAGDHERARADLATSPHAPAEHPHACGPRCSKRNRPSQGQHAERRRAPSRPTPVDPACNGLRRPRWPWVDRHLEISRCARHIRPSPFQAVLAMLAASHIRSEGT